MASRMRRKILRSRCDRRSRRKAPDRWNRQASRRRQSLPSQKITLTRRLSDLAYAASGRPAGGITLQIGMTRSEEHTSELQSLMRFSYDVFCLKNKEFGSIKII